MMTQEDLISLNTLSGEEPGYQGDPNFYEPYVPSTGGNYESVFDPNKSDTDGVLRSLTDAYKSNNFGSDVSGLGNLIKSLFSDSKGNLDLRKLGVLGGGVAGLLGATKSSSAPTGYQGSIPKYTATRNMVTAPEAGRRPGAGGTRYGGDVTFTPKGLAPVGSGIASVAPIVGGIASLGGSTAPVTSNPAAPQIPQQPVAKDDPFFQSPEYKAFQNDPSNMTATADMYDSPYFGRMSSGSVGSAMDSAYEKYKGIAPQQNISAIFNRLNSAPMDENQTFAEGGSTGRYLQGGTDGMADKIPAQIGKDQPAALSHGEFVIPADVVSHLGNGNSDAGAKKLYSMMDKIRQARTGNKKQGKKINPDKFMPGGLAYAAGGEVKKFAGETPSLVTADKNASLGITGSESNLSNWAGPYVTDMLGKGQALSEMPYQEYGGPLTAGASNLQNKVFSGLSNVNFPGQLGQSFSSAGAPTIGADGQPVGGGTSPASQYMNPYLQSVLQPQLAEMRRQAEITNQSGLGALTKAGAFGGGRQAIMESEAGRNLLQEQNKTIGQGYSNAYDKAMQQFNTEQGQGIGLANLMAGQGGIERGIESEGIAADKAAFEEARANPYKMVQFQQSLLSGLPLAAQSYQVSDPSNLTKFAQGSTTLNTLLKNLGLGP